MRLRDKANGVVVHVDDAVAEGMVGKVWEPADKPAPKPKAAPVARRSSK